MAVSQNEKPVVLEVKNDVVKVSIPDLSNTTKTYLTASVAAAGTTLTIRDASGLADNDLLVIGEVGQETTEKIEVNDGTPDTSLTITAVTYAHTIGTPITETPFDQVTLYGASSLTGDKSAIGSATDIDFASGCNYIIATTQYDYYFVRYSNTETSATSAYSEGYLASHPATNTRQGLKLAGLDLVNEVIDDNLITDDFLNREINNCQREIQDAYDGKCSFAVATDSTQTLSTGINYLTIPTDIANADYRSITSLRIEIGDSMEYQPYHKFLADSTTVKTTLAADIALTDTTITVTSDENLPSQGDIVIDGDTISYTSKSSNVLSGVTDISSTHSSGDTVYYEDDLDEPKYWTIYNSQILVRPIPSSTENGWQVHIDYFKDITDLDSDNDRTLVPFYGIFQYYLASKISYRLRKMGEGDRWMAMFREKLQIERCNDPITKDTSFKNIAMGYNSIH